MDNDGDLSVFQKFVSGESIKVVVSSFVARAVSVKEGGALINKNQYTIPKSLKASLQSVFVGFEIKLEQIYASHFCCSYFLLYKHCARVVPSNNMSLYIIGSKRSIQCSFK